MPPPAGDALAGFQLALAMNKMTFKWVLPAGAPPAEVPPVARRSTGCGCCPPSGGRYSAGDERDAWWSALTWVHGVVCGVSLATRPANQLAVIGKKLTLLCAAPRPCSKLRELHKCARENEDPELQVGAASETFKLYGHAALPQ